MTAARERFSFGVVEGLVQYPASTQNRLQNSRL